MRTPVAHNLKTHATHFKGVWDGKKRAEVRFDDHNFQVGDTLVLEETTACYYTGRKLTVRVTHILRGFVGLQHGYCMLSVAMEIRHAKTARRKIN